jgi:GNAT superfamily N-acetyltransferase
VDRAQIALMLDRGADFRLRDGRTVHVRPVRPTDAEAVQAFVRGLSDTARRLRFFAPIRELTPSMLKRLTEVDGRRDRVLVALARDDRGERVIALAQYAADGERCDLALVTADAWQRLGLGRLLMDMLIETAHDVGFARAEADVLRGNDALLGLARAFGFSVKHSPFEATMLRIVRELHMHWNTTPAAAQPPFLGEGRVQRPARSRSPANSSLQNPPPWKRSATGSGGSFACAANAASR